MIEVRAELKKHLDIIEPVSRYFYEGKSKSRDINKKKFESECHLLFFTIRSSNIYNHLKEHSVVGYAILENESNALGLVYDLKKLIEIVDKEISRL